MFYSHITIKIIQLLYRITSTFTVMVIMHLYIDTRRSTKLTNNDNYCTAKYLQIVLYENSPKPSPTVYIQDN